MKLWFWIVLVVVLLGLGVIFIQASKAQTVGQTLLWTAPGDDGIVGRASSYDLRYSTAAIVGTDTLTWWNGATQATGEPLPGISGTTDSLAVLGLQPSTVYRFLIRSADEVPNWSGFSNVAVVTTQDLVPPSRITDLRPRP